MESIEADEEVLFPELVFGLVGPIGVNMDDVQERLAEALRAVGYNSSIIHITNLLKEYEAPPSSASTDTAYERKISSANLFCRTAGNGAALVGLAMLEIQKIRRERLAPTTDSIGSFAAKGAPKQAYIIRQLKRMDEISYLRKVYGQKFVQVSVALSKAHRVANLVTKIAKDHPQMKQAVCEAKARKLIEIDENESEHITDEEYGQEVGEIFHKAEIFLNCSDSTKLSADCHHFIRAFFGDNSKSPRRDELGAYFAAAAALRSADLSRQVGAAIFDESGNIISTGCNEVPKAGGGAYWYGDQGIMRDFEKGVEQNGVEKQRIILDSVMRLRDAGIIDKTIDLDDPGTQSKLSSAFEEALVSDITEYGRMVHAEMGAITDAARLGRSLKGSTVYVTTFPCHNCAKHIVASGVRRVVYIEPYPKSRAGSSHEDSIAIDDHRPDLVSFEHFEGISPLRFREIFQKGKRRSGNKVEPWYEKEPCPRIEQRDNLHIKRETVAINMVMKGIRAASGHSLE